MVDLSIYLYIYIYLIFLDTLNDLDRYSKITRESKLKCKEHALEV